MAKSRRDGMVLPARYYRMSELFGILMVFVHTNWQQNESVIHGIMGLLRKDSNEGDKTISAHHST